MQRKTCQQDAPPLTDEQRAELDQRLNAYEKDKIKGREVSEVVKTLKERLWSLSRPARTFERLDRWTEAFSGQQ
ncbi:MAG: addiction module protein [Nitrospira sp.]|nr:addiction module protein [Nitrospira sp.]